MKTKLRTLLAVATALGSTIAIAQDERRPEGDRPPGSQQEGRPRPEGQQQLQRPDGQQRPMADRSRPLDGRVRGGPQGERMRPQQPAKPTAYLGVITTPVSPQLGAQLGLPEGFGLVVEEVAPDSPAKAAGVERFDVLKLLGDQKLTDPGQLAKLVRAEGKDAQIVLTVIRKGQEQKLTAKVGEKLMPERRSLDWSVGDLRRKLEESREPAEERMKNMQRKMQERMKDFQERMRDFQKKLEEWRKNPTSPAPEPPKLETEKFGAIEPGGPLPPNVLREMLPGGAPEVKIAQDGSTTRWNTASARVMIKDEAGEIAVSSQDGHRTVVAKNPTGETVFTGPLDTPEQRQALPEDIRRKIEKLEVRTRAEHPLAPPPVAVGDDNLAQDLAEPEI